MRVTDRQKSWNHIHEFKLITFYVESASMILVVVLKMIIKIQKLWNTFMYEMHFSEMMKQIQFLLVCVYWYSYTQDSFLLRFLTLFTFKLCLRVLVDFNEICTTSKNTVLQFFTQSVKVFRLKIDIVIY